MTDQNEEDKDVAASTTSDDPTLSAKLHEVYLDGYRRGVKLAAVERPVGKPSITEAHVYRVVLTIPGYEDQKAEFSVLSSNSTIGDELLQTVRKVYEHLQSKGLQNKNVSFEDCIVKSVDLQDRAFGFTAPTKEQGVVFTVSENGLACVDPARVAFLAGLPRPNEDKEVTDLGSDAAARPLRTGRLIADLLTEMGNSDLA
jgi:hypothetical protein